MNSAQTLYSKRIQKTIRAQALKRYFKGVTNQLNKPSYRKTKKKLKRMVKQAFKKAVMRKLEIHSHFKIEEENNQTLQIMMLLESKVKTWN